MEALVVELSMLQESERAVTVGGVLELPVPRRQLDFGFVSCPVVNALGGREINRSVTRYHQRNALEEGRVTRYQPNASKARTW